MANVVVYALTEPDQPWNIRYIGQTVQRGSETPEQSVRRRASQHYHDCLVKGSSHRQNWIRSLRKKGQRPGHLLLDLADNETSGDALEMFHIASYRAAGYRLVNNAIGGDHGSRGAKWSEEQKSSVAGRYKGRKASTETRARQSAALKGKKKSPEHLSKLRLRMPSFGGRQHTDETRAKMSNTRRVIWALNRERLSALNKASRQEHLATHCANGHEFTPENTIIPADGRRRCRECRRKYDREWKQKRKLTEGKTLQVASHLKTHCPQGHEYTPENTVIYDGKRNCRECRRLRDKANREKRRSLLK